MAFYILPILYCRRYRPHFLKVSYANQIGVSNHKDDLSIQISLKKQRKKKNVN